MADKHYRVSWQTDQWAPNPEQAARQAKIVQKDPNSIANHFTVRDMDYGDNTTVDLDDERALMAGVNSEEVPEYLMPGPVVMTDKKSELEIKPFDDDAVIERALEILRSRLNMPDFEGTIDGASIYPREVVKAALKYNAAAVILTHNHPSGVPEPSSADERITKRLKEALTLVDVRLLDHIIVGGTESVSLAERGVV